MTVVHIVQFRFKDGTSPEAVSKVSCLGCRSLVLFFHGRAHTNANLAYAVQACAHILSLKETCMHPQSNKPYITSLTGGKDNSPEGLQVRVPALESPVVAVLRGQTLTDVI